jgi:hypothetical protein
VKVQQGAVLGLWIHSRPEAAQALHPCCTSTKQPTNDSKATVSVLYWYGNYPTLTEPSLYDFLDSGLAPAPGQLFLLQYFSSMMPTAVCWARCQGTHGHSIFFVPHLAQTAVSAPSKLWVLREENERLCSMQEKVLDREG